MTDIGASEGSVASRMAWNVRRLKMMSRREVAQRIGNRARLEIWHRRRVWPSAVFACEPSPDHYRLPPLEDPAGRGRVLEQAEAMLDGRVVLLGQPFALSDVRWNLDPQSGRSSPPSFGPLLDYRDSKLAGNARNVWELNRHQHLTVAALAYALTRDERFAHFVRQQLETWLDQNPFPVGINWSSPLECGLRLISWVWISRFLSASEVSEILFGPCGRMWPSVFRHQWMIAKLRSFGSSANNHLIGEMAGLLTSALAWPWFDDSRAWAALAHRILEEESDLQFYGTGLNREQAFGYHVFATDLLLLAGLEGERNGRPFSPGYLDRLLRAVQAIARQSAQSGLLPAYGDYDDGVAIGLPDQRRPPAGRVAAVASAWLGESERASPPSPECRLATAILLAGVTAPRRQTPAAHGAGVVGPRSEGLSDAGVYVMRSAAGGEELMVMADAGELGYLSIAAHGHADALSFTLSVGLDQVLVDPGTFAYHHDPAARIYFRGTQAHNTITLDGRDQSQQGGPFLWTTKAKTTVHRWRETKNGAVLTASHDGYERLAGPVTHWRRFALNGGRLTVDDRLIGEGAHHLEWRLHFAPECSVRLENSACLVESRHHLLAIRLDPKLKWEAIRGDERGGWYSSAFNRRCVTTTLVGSARITPPVHLRHDLSVMR